MVVKLRLFYKLKELTQGVGNGYQSEQRYFQNNLYSLTECCFKSLTFIYCHYYFVCVWVCSCVQCMFAWWHMCAVECMGWSEDYFVSSALSFYLYYGSNSMDQWIKFKSLGFCSKYLLLVIHFLVPDYNL